MFPPGIEPGPSPCRGDELPLHHGNGIGPAYEFRTRFSGLRGRRPSPSSPTRVGTAYGYRTRHLRIESTATTPSSPTLHKFQGHDCFEMPKPSGIGVIGGSEGNRTQRAFQRRIYSPLPHLEASLPNLVAPDGLEPSLQAYETRVGTCRVAMNWWESAESNSLPFQERIYSPLQAPA